MSSVESVMGKRFRLSNGLAVPAMGTATFRLRFDEAVYNHIDKCLAAGYRLFDTAAIHGNEVNLKHAFATLLPKYGLERSDIFITSKLVTVSTGDYANVTRCLQRTLSNLGVDYLDLFLAHYPTGNDNNCTMVWNVFQRLYDEGVVAAIGVYNYSVDQLREITTTFSAPMVNQVEWHPMMQNEELYTFCRMHDILIQSYCPFGTRFDGEKGLYNNNLFKKLVQKYQVTPSQLTMMWSMQLDVALVPATLSPFDLNPNINFDLKLTPSDLRKLNALAPTTDDFAGLM